jgi:putative membrane protein
MKKFINNRFQFSLMLLFVIYAVGIVSVLTGHADDLMKLTFFNLLFATALLLFNAEEIGKTYLGWFLIVALAGYLVELLGIETGWVFGEYQYGSGLGLKLFDVPFIIGINWAVLVFASAAIVNEFLIPGWLKAALAATIMVLYDVLLEPVAVRFDFWNWNGGAIPMQNYIAWWIIAFLMLLGITYFTKNLKNRIALYIIAVQAIFFIIVILQQGLTFH